LLKEALFYAVEDQQNVAAQLAPANQDPKFKDNGEDCQSFCIYVYRLEWLMTFVFRQDVIKGCVPMRELARMITQQILPPPVSVPDEADAPVGEADDEDEV
jgi:hypothetical protein